MSNIPYGYRGRHGQSFKQAIAKPQKLGPEYNPWFWNPSRVDARFAPDEFRKRLKREMGSELEVTWNPINQRWQIWSQSPRTQSPICQGWRLLFIHNGPSGEHLPLDERVFARLYHASVMAHGSGKAYFERIVQEMDRDRARKDKAQHQDLLDRAMPSFEHSKIQVSGAGKSNGSKFSTYHA